MSRAHSLLLAVLLSGCASSSHGGGGMRAAAGPGAGYLTRQAPLARALRAGYSVLPILTAGDTLFAEESGAAPFVFAGRAGGLGVRTSGDGNAFVYVSHDDAFLDAYEGGMVSRLTMDLRNAGIYAGDYALRPIDGYNALAHAKIADSRAGFLRPFLLVSEWANRLRTPSVAAVEGGGAPVQDLPWLGAMSHKSTVPIPLSGGRLAMILTGGSTTLGTGRDQLYLFLASSDADVLSGNGTLYVFRADPAALRGAGRSAAELRRGVPITGTFVPIDRGTALSPGALESRVQQLGCLNFARLEDVAIDRERGDGFYFTDRFAYATGTTLLSSAGGGRLYHVLLDPFDPTQVRELSVVLDAGEGDDLYRPSSIDTDAECVMIQEDPGARGLHPARILRFDVRTRRLEPVAVCLERDSRGRALAEGVGGAWETSGIVNVSDFLGEDSWLFTVQAHTLRAPQASSHWGEAGQLLLLRGARSPRGGK